MPLPSPHRRYARTTALALAAFVSVAPTAFAQNEAGNEPQELERQVEPARFEHLRTGFALEGAHIDARCETCHARQIFQGTPRRCSQCHVIGGTLATTAKPLQHLPTVQECDNCHDQYAWSGAYFVHGTTTAGRCTSCHNGASAPGKPADHIPTTSQCDSCHRTDGWLPVNFGGALKRSPPEIETR